MIEAPQSFVVRTECAKAANDNGFRIALGEADGWAGFASTTVPGRIWLAAAGMRGPWYLALDHGGVAAELALYALDLPGPGLLRHGFDNLASLHGIVARIYQLSASLPDEPLERFRKQVSNLPRRTEAERLVVQRIGQDIFRASLMDYWQGRCPLTGITDPALLRASHIIAWKDCTSDAERLDVHNGLLLSALWDAAFDRGLVTFDDVGRPEFSPKLSETAQAELRWHAPIPLTDKHRARLAWHRTEAFGEIAP